MEAASGVDALLARWRRGIAPRISARELGLTGEAHRRLLARHATDADHAARREALGARRRARSYADEDLTGAIATVGARLGRAPTAREYHALADPSGPSLPTVVGRLGGWSAALEAAGLAVTRPRRRATPRWSEDACWMALRALVAERGEIPTVRAYGRLAARRADLPSLSTVRNRLGRWTVVANRLAVERELDALHVPPLMPAVLHRESMAIAGVLR